MFDNLFTVENLLNVLGAFAYLFGELFLLFIAISFFVALLQVWVSKDRIKRILSRPHKVTNAVLGAALGAVTPFCSCSTIPVLVGLFKSGAPFSGAISFLMTSPILNPAIIALLLVFFGPVPTAVYAVITFAFAVCAGLVLDALGFSRYIKNVAVKGGCCGGEEATWENLKGTFWQKQAQACKYALKDAIGLFKGFIGWLRLGAGIGAFIYGFVPTELLEGFAGADNLWAIPLAAVIGIPMYIRVETMIPIAGILMEKGVSSGIVIALILGGVSLTRMKTDLFPEMDLPYLAVITTDPGASAEKVEAEVTDPLEGSLASVNGVKSITSQSNDNYSLVFLEFEDDTDMDSALVKVSSAVNEVIALLPDGVGTPNYMEISADMMATMYIGAHDDDRDIYELSDLVEDKVVPALERLDGGGLERPLLDEERVVELFGQRAHRALEHAEIEHHVAHGALGL